MIRWSTGMWLVAAVTSAAAGAGSLGLVLACSGSMSETPWPAEPIDLEAGPAGEQRNRGNVIDTRKLPDNYTKRPDGGAPEDEVGDDDDDDEDVDTSDDDVDEDTEEEEFAPEDE
jgi:hypothetical protein